jgi:hypothetical protein
MHTIKRSFLRILKEAPDTKLPEIDNSDLENDKPDALSSNRDDDVSSFIDTLDDPYTDNDLEKIVEPDVNYERDLASLKSWIINIDKIKKYFNGSNHSVLGKLKDEAKAGTLFDDINETTKNEILDVVERLASINEGLRKLYIEKHK